jgi:hypothetical protein
MLSKQRCTWLLLGLALGLISNAGCGGSGTSGGSPTPPPPPITPTAPPTQPVDKTPINGEVYYVINQLSDLQADLTNDSTAIGDHVIQQQRSFTNLGQRWAFTKLSAGGWQINNMSSTYCFDTAIISSVTYVVQNPCTGSATEQWTLTPSTNGYYTIANTSTGFVMDVFQASAFVGAWLDLSALSGSPTQAQQWLLRPAFFRGVDNALLEKQEAARSAAGRTRARSRMSSAFSKTTASTWCACVQVRHRLIRILRKPNALETSVTEKPKRRIWTSPNVPAIWG